MENINCLEEKFDFSKITEGFTFDDLLLVPSYSGVTHRADVDICQKIWDMKLGTPIIPANMSTISEEKMVEKIISLGGTAAMHRFMSPEEYFIKYSSLNIDCKGYAGITIGLNEEWNSSLFEKIKGMGQDYLPPYVIIDIAHGHHKRVFELVKNLRVNYGELFDPYSGIKVIVGNICTTYAAKDFLYKAKIEKDKRYIIHGLKCGIGGGSCCTTRLVTGCGYPQLSAIKEVSDVVREYNKEKNQVHKVITIADGGIRNSGDVVKAIAAGADLVMSGALFAGCIETPGESYLTSKGLKKKFRGMASKEENKLYFGKNFKAPEGVEHEVDSKGSIVEVIEKMNWGIKSGLSYCGCSNFEELREYGNFYSSWVRITNAGAKEGTPHYKS